MEFLKFESKDIFAAYTEMVKIGGIACCILCLTLFFASFVANLDLYLALIGLSFLYTLLWFPIGKGLFAAGKKVGKPSEVKFGGGMGGGIIAFIVGLLNFVMSIPLLRFPSYRIRFPYYFLVSIGYPLYLYLFLFFSLLVLLFFKKISNIKGIVGSLMVLGGTSLSLYRMIMFDLLIRWSLNLDSLLMSFGMGLIGLGMLNFADFKMGSSGKMDNFPLSLPQIGLLLSLIGGIVSLFFDWALLPLFEFIRITIYFPRFDLKMRIPFDQFLVGGILGLVVFLLIYCSLSIGGKKSVLLGALLGILLSYPITRGVSTSLYYLDVLQVVNGTIAFVPLLGGILLQLDPKKTWFFLFWISSFLVFLVNLLGGIFTILGGIVLTMGTPGLAEYKNENERFKRIDF